MPADLTLTALTSIPTIEPGDDLAALLLAAAARETQSLRDGDLVVVAQKIVSKAEGRFVELSTVSPSSAARNLAAETGKDPRLVELILSESREVLRTRPGLIIVVHRLGYIMANAGIDRSNVGSGEETVLLLPSDPDASAQRLRQRLSGSSGARVGVIVSDSFGRPWRLGTTGVAIGVAGPAMVQDRRGQPDRDGRLLQVTEIGFADGLAAAAVLVMGEGAESRPAVIVRGVAWEEAGGGTASGLRSPSMDLFR